MKKVLVIHNQYQNLGGEDIAIKNEIKVLKENFEVKEFFSTNNTKINFKLLKIFFSLKNKEIDNKLELVLKEFKPDLVFVHNTWFYISLGIFDVLSKNNIKTVLKLHNFRYFCSSFIFSKNHKTQNNLCEACGFNKKNHWFFNRYFKESLIKSLLVIWYGKKYIKILKNNNIKILVLTNFHKNFIAKFISGKSNLEVMPNLILENKFQQPNSNINDNYIVYAGRISSEKGVEQLIKTFLECDFKKLKLKILGSGPKLEEYTKKFRDENIEFEGLKSNNEVLHIISNSKAVVTATKLYEGQPTLLCEASNLGIASIFPESGGISEFFPKNYKYSFTPGNYEDLKEKLLLIIQDDEQLKTQGAKNKQFITEYLNKEKVFLAYEKIING